VLAVEHLFEALLERMSLPFVDGHPSPPAAVLLR